MAEDNKPKVEQPKAKPKEKSKEVAKKVEQPKEVEQPEQKSDEKLVPKFKNNGKDIKINLGTRDESNWITVKTGQIVTIPRKIALANGLEEVK